jgi:Flp pilus assembly protein TadB
LSKERARRRADREREAAIRTAARAAEQERRERQAARKQAVRAATTDRLRRPAVGRDTGTLARRRRAHTTWTVVLLLVLVVLVWVVRDDWAARVGALVVAALAFPVVRLVLFGRR